MLKKLADFFLYMTFGNLVLLFGFMAGEMGVALRTASSLTAPALLAAS